MLEENKIRCAVDFIDIRAINKTKPIKILNPNYMKFGIVSDIVYKIVPKLKLFIDSIYLGIIYKK